jgi:phosphoribosylamine---glycine ligase
MKVLVVGGGGREHAMIRALTRSPSEPELFCAPGNAGIAADAEILRVGSEDVEGVVGAARDTGIDLVLVGPEAPLVAGIVDALEEVGIAAFGPTGAAAQLEGSKLFAKNLMKEAGVPTAGHTVVGSAGEALRQLGGATYPIVLKADGLAAGKGVIIAATEAEARDAADVFFTERRFGETRVVIEEFLDGEELSLLALCDGENVLPLAPAQDYKRIRDNDEGPNTGGMGSYSPVPAIDPAEVERLADLVHRPVVDAMKRRGIPFHGVLYAGLMLTQSGPKVLEFNCRFGDPETQAVLPRLRSDLIGLCLATRTEGGLSGLEASFADDWAVTVVLASAGYPESSSKGDVISGLEEAAETEGVEITHAGTARRDGEIVTAGGRVLNVTGVGATAAEARRRAYDAAELISFDGKQLRSDIAARAVSRAAPDEPVQVNPAPSAAD